MNVAVTTDHRFVRTPEGAIWTQGINAYEFWQRYLATFERVKVIGRLLNAPRVNAGWRRADGPGVVFTPVPNYLGPWQYLRKAREVRHAVRAAFDRRDAVIMRVGSHIAGCLESHLARIGHPYGLEVVNDPFDVFAPGAVRYQMRPLFRWWFTRQLRRQCRHAAGVAYVTTLALQKRYPCGAYSVGMSDVEIASEGIVADSNVFTTHYSSVELAQEDSVSSHRRPIRRAKSFRLVTVASLAQMYKAPDVLIRAVARCVHAGFDVTLKIAGDGKHRPELERLAARLGIEQRVTFLGQLAAGAEVRSELDASDLFVLPSRCEGLPRAMVEAMARALPCIGSSVGGIPELLAPEDLVPPGDVESLAGKILEVLASPARMSAMSARNLARAQEYRDEVLAVRRKAFFEHIRQSTSAWLSRSDGRADDRNAGWEGC
jgi:glycosyltransferase involved in cell wall biosynthesis